MNTIHILIADDHTIFRQGLVSLLKNEVSIATIGEAANGHEVLAYARQQQPDVVLMDVEMPIKNGVATTKELKKELPQIKILALTMHNSSTYIKQILKAGANGYILKDATKEELLTAITTVVQGKPYHSPMVTKTIMTSLHKKETTTTPLSERELQVIQLIANQHTIKDIAAKLHLSPLTVETHRKNIYLKLGVHNAAGLVKLAIKNGWAE